MKPWMLPRMQPHKRLERRIKSWLWSGILIKTQTIDSRRSRSSDRLPRHMRYSPTKLKGRSITTKSTSLNSPNLVIQRLIICSITFLKNRGFNQQTINNSSTPSTKIGEREKGASLLALISWTISSLNLILKISERSQDSHLLSLSPPQNLAQDFQTSVLTHLTLIQINLETGKRGKSKK